METADMVRRRLQVARVVERVLVEKVPIDVVVLRDDRLRVQPAAIPREVLHLTDDAVDLAQRGLHEVLLEGLDLELRGDDLVRDLHST